MEKLKSYLANMDLEDRLIIALDFGTTYSGIAYAFAGSEKPEVVSIMEWPGLEGYKQPKIPTVISYDPKAPDRFTWGAQKHESGHSAVHGIKLLLDPDQPRPHYLPKLAFAADLEQLGKSAVDVCSDYIRAIYKHAMEQIKSSVPEDYLEMCKKEFVLSVPAVWSDKAKDLTLQAATKAGIEPIELIKEPEAAALYTLQTLKRKALSVGNALVVVDAGGGTVDLISYEITQLYPRLELKELVPSKGGMAGSLGLNMRFEAEVEAMVGEEAFSRLRKTKGYEQAMNQFDKSVKTAFRGDLFEDYYINFPLAGLKDDPIHNLAANCWNMKGQDLEEIFDPLIEDIERMVKEQVESVRVKSSEAGYRHGHDIKAILLVGGFGSNVYLKNRLAELHPDIQIIQPHGAWSAIVKGAVLSKLSDGARIISTVATRHYGYHFDADFITGQDDAYSQTKYWNASLGEYRLLKMKWCIARGDNLKRDERIKFPFFRYFKMEGFSPTSLKVEDILQGCATKVAPQYPSRTINPICTLTSDLTGLDPSTFKKRLGKDNVWYYDVYFHLVITTMSATMKFSLEVDGVEMGIVVAEYE